MKCVCMSGQVLTAQTWRTGTLTCLTRLERSTLYPAATHKTGDTDQSKRVRKRVHKCESRGWEQHLKCWKQSLQLKGSCTGKSSTEINLKIKNIDIMIFKALTMTILEGSCLQIQNVDVISRQIWLFKKGLCKILITSLLTAN